MLANVLVLFSIQSISFEHKKLHHNIFILPVFCSQYYFSCFTSGRKNCNHYPCDTGSRESPGHAARVVVDQGDIHLTRVTLQKLKAWNNWNMEVMLQCWCLGITYGQMLTYQLSTFSFSSDFVCDRCAFDHFDSTNLLQQNFCFL